MLYNFEQQLADFMKNAPKKKERDFVIYTGSAGAKAINEAIAEEAEEQFNPLEKRLDALYVGLKITFDQKERLLTMIKSKNKEDKKLAREVIKNLENVVV